MKRFTVLLAFSFIFFFCNLYSQDRSNPQVIKILKDFVRPDLKLSELLKEVKYLPLETTEECLISQIGKIVISNRRIYILDSKTFSILVFSDEGKFLWKLNKVGRGPEEYPILYDFCIEPITKNVVILKPNGLNYYSKDGAFIKTTKIEFTTTAFGFPDEQHIALSNIGSTDGLIITDNNGKKIAGYFQNVKETDFGLRAPFIKNVNSGLLYFRYLDYTIFEIAGTRIIPHVKFDSDNNIYSEKDLGSLKTNIDNINNFIQIVQYIECESNIMIHYLLKNELFCLVYTKKTKKTDIINSEKIKNDISFTGNFLLNIKSNDYENGFVSFIESNELKPDLLLQNHAEPSLISISNNSKITDNPILVFLKFK
jgi:hypothetical protein